MNTSKRFETRSQRPINRETFIHPWPEVGLIVAESPYDPAPGLVIEKGVVVEMDGVARADFDMLDVFIAEHSLDLDVAAEAMATPSLDIARMLVDINVSRDEVLRLTRGCTAAKLVDIVRYMNVLEMMMGLTKLRARRAPANQAHVTNRAEHPTLLAADAAEAALRGFAEVETTVGVSRYAPLNALAILVGSQTGRAGVLTQCAVEEATNLRLGIRGLTTYSETLSVYGTERAFVDGDDTPWSKAFLNAAYASRGVKTRFTSGTGSEALMGHAEGKSMLYLEARCLLVTRGAGSQGTQNGSISCIALPESLPGGVRAVLAENLIAMMLGLEVAAGNDALASHSEMRKSAKLMLQFIPGTDFVTSGYGAIPRYDNMFGGGNFDTTELDDWYVIQRDMQVDGGIHPVKEEAILHVRERAARAIQAIFDAFDFAQISDAEVQAAITAYSSRDMPDRDRISDLKAAQLLLNGPITVLEVIRVLEETGHHDIAANLLELQRQRATGDYLQPSGIFDKDFTVLSALTTPNNYTGPGTGYRVEGERWERLQDIPQAWDPKAWRREKEKSIPGGEESSENQHTGASAHYVSRSWLHEIGPAPIGVETEVVVAVGPAFGIAIEETIGGLDLREVLAEVLSGIAEEGVPARVVRVYHTSDCAFIGHAGAQLSGSGVAIGMQSKGTTVIHQRDLAPLENLELFSMAPNMDLTTYRQIGRNAARYAQHKPTVPVPVKIDNTARLRLIVQTTLLHRQETEMVEAGKEPTELRLSDVVGNVFLPGSSAQFPKTSP
ncbi:MAG: propanediol/glycerol family dehydratase large subunit [Anaerolineae bacterium]|nr:propanediol/glycerol family dehydratase large subunit [Anaerolineae bacterium]